MAEYDLKCKAPGSWGNGVCGNPFTAGRSDAKACSPNCRKRIWRAKPENVRKAKIASLERQIRHHDSAAVRHQSIAAAARRELARLELEANGQTTMAGTIERR